MAVWDDELPSGTRAGVRPEVQSQPSVPDRQTGFDPLQTCQETGPDMDTVGAGELFDSGMGQKRGQPERRG